MQTRRALIAGGGAVALVAIGFGVRRFWPGEAPRVQDPAAPSTPPATSADLGSTAADFVLGQANAPVTIIEYASMTCGHCATFAKTTYPELKKRYIDTGKVRYILREFPLDPLAAAGFMLAHCAAKGDANKYYAMIDTLFHQQDTWVVQKPIPPLQAIGRQAGLTESDVNACLANQSMLDKIEEVKKAGITLGVTSTPTFFINGEKVSGAVSIDELAQKIDPYLKTG